MYSILKKVLKSIGLARYVPGVIPMNVRQMRNLLYHADIYSHIKDVDGAIVECGVGLGRSFMQLNFLALQEGKSRHVWGFDSFEGFPEPSVEDASSRNPKKGEWSGTSPNDIRKILTTAGIPTEWVRANVNLVKGFFNNSLSSYDKSPIALLHIDADLYESYKDVLNTLYPLVVSGGVVMFDEYDQSDWPGSKKAINEFFGDAKVNLKIHPISKKRYLVKP